MRFAKFLNGLVTPGPGWSDDFVVFGFVMRNPILPTEGIHEHAVDEDDGFGFDDKLQYR